MPPKKAPLYCLVHGDPISSLFGIKYDKNTTVDELRKVIWKEEIEVPEHVKAKDLTLYQVNIDLATQNTQHTALTNPNANIVNDLGGQMLNPMGIIGEKFPTPASGHIHVIVDVPVSPASARSAEESTLKRSIERLTEYVDRLTKKQKLSFSKINQTQLDELLSHLNFRRITSNITVPPTDKIFTPYEWDDRDEDKHADDRVNESGQTKQGYMNFLKSIITIPATSDWYDPKFKKELLSIDDNSLPYNLKGTTDVLVMKKSFMDIYDFRSGILAGLEIKKNVKESDSNQAIGELIAANIISNYPVFIVLTDLKDVWIFYWLTNEKTVAGYRALPRDAITIVETALTKSESTESTEDLTVVNAGFPIATRINFRDLRDDLPHVELEETEGLNLFLNRPKVRFEFEDDVANMKDVFDVMTEDEISDWKVKRALRLLGETPSFQLDENDKNYMSGSISSSKQELG